MTQWIKLIFFGAKVLQIRLDYIYCVKKTGDLAIAQLVLMASRPAAGR